MSRWRRWIVQSTAVATKEEWIVQSTPHDPERKDASSPGERTKTRARPTRPRARQVIPARPTPGPHGPPRANPPPCGLRPATPGPPCPRHGRLHPPPGNGPLQAPERACAGRTPAPAAFSTPIPRPLLHDPWCGPLQALCRRWRTVAAFSAPMVCPVSKGSRRRAGLSRPAPRARPVPYPPGERHACADPEPRGGMTSIKGAPRALPGP